MPGHLHERRPGVWSLVCDQPRAPDGQRRQATRTYHGTRKGAELALAALVAEVNGPAYAPAAKDTVAEILASWLASCKMRGCRPQTLAAYERQIRLHLGPSLGRVPAASLTALDVERHLARQAEGHLGPRSVAYQLRVLRTALRWAQRRKVITYNAAEDVDPPRAPRPRHVILTPEQTGTLLEASRAHWLWPIVVLAVATGMRRNEILGLRWADVDLSIAVVCVRQALVRVNGRNLFTAPKSESSLRSIVLPAFAVTALTQHQAAQAALRAQVSRYARHDLVCARPDGEPWSSAQVNAAFARLLERAGLPHVPPHSLRHGHGSHLLDGGVALPVVAARLGHASPVVTASHYLHALEDGDSRAAGVLGKLLERG